LYHRLNAVVLRRGEVGDTVVIASNDGFSNQEVIAQMSCL